MLEKLLPEHVLFIDIETVPQYENLASAPEKMQILWTKKAGQIGKAIQHKTRGLTAGMRIYVTYFYHQGRGRGAWDSALVVRVAGVYQLCPVAAEGQRRHAPDWSRQSVVMSLHAAGIGVTIPSVRLGMQKRYGRMKR